MKPRAVVFDAYGTLFDVHAAVLRDGHGITGDLRALSELWRRQQLEYTWLRSLMERYEDFRILTEAALRSAVGQLRLQASEAQLGDLMRAYLFPSAFSDVKTGLGIIEGNSAGDRSANRNARNVGIRRTAQCPSNRLLTRLFQIAGCGLTSRRPGFTRSALKPFAFGRPRCCFVSSNWWDVAGARSFWLYGFAGVTDQSLISIF